MQQTFIPCTLTRSIGNGVVFRPIKSWHSATFAGEGLLKIPESDDGSGCVRPSTEGSYQKLCPIPLTVTHRLYWHESNPDKTISAFLSYPEAMGYYGDKEYFWEIYGTGDDIERFGGEQAEAEMEVVICKFFNPTKESLDA